MQKKYRQNVSGLKFTSVEDTPEMVQAKVSNKLAVDVSPVALCCFPCAARQESTRCRRPVHKY